MNEAVDDRRAATVSTSLPRHRLHDDQTIAQMLKLVNSTTC